MQKHVTKSLRNSPATSSKTTNCNFYTQYGLNGQARYNITNISELHSHWKVIFVTLKTVSSLSANCILALSLYVMHKHECNSDLLCIIINLLFCKMSNFSIAQSKTFHFSQFTLFFGFLTPIYNFLLQMYCRLTHISGNMSIAFIICQCCLWQPGSFILLVLHQGNHSSSYKQQQKKKTPTNQTSLDSEEDSREFSQH